MMNEFNFELPRFLPDKIFCWICFRTSPVYEKGFRIMERSSRAKLELLYLTNSYETQRFSTALTSALERSIS